MTMLFVNSVLLSRFDELIHEGELHWQEFQKDEKRMIMDIVGFTQWSTSCLNLLDKLSISTNRFVTQFEVWAVGGPGKQMNIGAALGVLKSARHEYSCGLAIEYQLSVSAVVFSGLLDEATYLFEKGYPRAAAVLLGAALEEGLKARARAVPIALSPRVRYHQSSPNSKPQRLAFSQNSTQNALKRSRASGMTRHMEESSLTRPRKSNQQSKRSKQCSEGC